MTISKLSAGSAGAIFIVLAGSAAYAAHSDGGYMCQTFSMAKASPPSTHCITWTTVAAARMRAFNCDPGKMAAAAMRARCAELMASTQQPAPPPAGG